MESNYNRQLVNNGATRQWRATMNLSSIDTALSYRYTAQCTYRRKRNEKNLLDLIYHEALVTSIIAPVTRNQMLLVHRRHGKLSTHPKLYTVVSYQYIVDTTHWIHDGMPKTIEAYCFVKFAPVALRLMSFERSQQYIIELTES